MVTVYVDILIILNAFVNLLILLITSLFLRQPAKILRQVAASFVGSLFSLYIFLPSTPFAVELLIRLLCAAVTVVICFGFGNLLRFVRLCAVFYAVSFMYAGVMLALWFFVKPSSMAINNGVVYISVSPVILIGTSLAAYLILSLIKRVSLKNAAQAENCKLKIKLWENEVTVTAMIDTGHSVRDIMSTSHVIIVDKKVLDSLLGKELSKTFFDKSFDQENSLKERYRVVPCSTVSGTVMLDALRCDCLYVYRNDRVYKLDSPLLAVSLTPIANGYQAIAGTDILQVIV